MIVYRITNVLNGKQYVGQTTTTFAARWDKHKRRGHALTAAIKKYGAENFTHLILSECTTIDELNNAEEYWVDYYQTLSPNGYNMVTGGRNKKASEETRKKQSEAHKGKPAPWNSYKRSPETLKAMSERQKGRPGYWTGKKRPIMNAKAVVDVRTGVVYASGKLAAKALGISPSHACNILQGKVQSSKGILLKYVGTA